MNVSIGPWNVEVDPPRTRQTYREILARNAMCQCAGCRNFRAACESEIPEWLQSFVQSVGIDDCGNAIITDGGPSEPNEPYFRTYFGQYLFWGAIHGPFVQRLVERDGVSYYLFGRGVGIPREFISDEALAIHFRTDLPWVLNEKPDT